MSRLLSELDHETIVAHARSVRLIGESRRKDDRLDAMTLARLVRIDPRLLCPVKHRSAEAQADLTVIRARAALVRTRTMLVKSLRDSHIHCFDCGIHIQNNRKKHRIYRSTASRKGLVTDVSGPQGNACPGTLTPRLERLDRPGRARRSSWLLRRHDNSGSHTTRAHRCDT